MQLALFNNPLPAHFFLPVHLSSLSSNSFSQSLPAISSVFQSSNSSHSYHRCLSLLQNCTLVSPATDRQFQTATLTEMSSRRSRSRQSGSSRITEEQISDLVSKLQDLLPEARLQSNARVPSARVLQETCNYIRSLHQEVDDLSERLSELLATSDMSSAQAAIIRSLLM